jgi:pimeloyl-ACP methyl ester carboxylesterase
MFDGKEQLKESCHFLESNYSKSTIEGLLHYHPNLETLYMFGWSGSLANHERQKAATALYAGLKELASQYEQERGHKPAIHLISHSHGGNVILHMANDHDSDSTFEIDTVILLACPVQKQMYAFYSQSDLIQVLAPNLLNTHSFAWKGLRWYPFSHRRFPEIPTLKQAAVLIDGKEPSHNTFKNKKFLEHLPYIVETLNSNRSIDCKEEIITIDTVRKAYVSWPISG